MSGHSKWATTFRTKSAADAKRGAIFTKLGNLITIAARQGGGDLDANFSLRLVVEKARAANMPKENIERAIKRGTGQGSEGAVLDQILYEIIGPAGTVFVADGVTDNKNRTVSELKAILNRNNGQLGSANSALWMFSRKGMIIIDKQEIAGKDADELELSIIDAGAEDIIQEDEDWIIYTLPENLQKTQQSLKGLGLSAKESTLTYVPKDEMQIEDKEIQERIEKLFSALDNLDDINNVYTNASW